MRKNTLYSIICISLIMFIPFVVSETIDIQNQIIRDNVLTPTKEKSQEEKDCREKGCFEEDRCYFFGYIKDGQYCDERVRMKRPRHVAVFVNQSNTGEFCNQSYECKTNICSDNICINITRQQKEIENLNKEIEFLKDEITGLNINENIIETNEVEEIPEEKGIFQIIINFFKNIFGKKK